MKMIRRLLLDTDGPTAAEYAVMLALILIMCIAAITTVGGETANFWGNNRDELQKKAFK
jgi:pilus assembly protein Flp/PilA